MTAAYTAHMTEPRTAEPDSTDDRTRVANVLVENHRAFLRFLERRVGDRALAEDLLQDAFTRNLDRLSDVPDEGLVPWFYRVLRNAAIDRHRRKGAEERALAAFAQELADAAQPAEDLHREICACVGRLASTLKPEYAEVLQAVDVEDTPVKAFAETAGPDGVECRRPALPGARGAAAAGGGVLWDVRRTRLRRLLVRKTLGKSCV